MKKKLLLFLKCFVVFVAVMLAANQFSCSLALMEISSWWRNLSGTVLVIIAVVIYLAYRVLRKERVDRK